LRETYQLKSSKLNSLQIIEQIIQLYGSKMDSLNRQIAGFSEDLSSQPDLNKLGSLVHLFVFCDEFNYKLWASSH
jgi:hypothetical protein